MPRSGRWLSFHAVVLLAFVGRSDEAGMVGLYPGSKKCQHLVRHLIVCELPRLDDSGQDIVLGQFTLLLEPALLFPDNVVAHVFQISTNIIESVILLKWKLSNNPFRNHEMQGQEYESTDFRSQ